MSEIRSSSPPIVRFAPSPTGYLHIGNARPALFNWLFALNQGGTFVLRIDDTDRERSTEAFASAIDEDLAWLGIHPHVRVVQSERLALYDAAATALRAAGRLYPCYETADELDRRRKRQLVRGLPPVYDRSALQLTDADRASLEAQGRRPHWRFKLSPGDVAFNDLVRGPVHVDPASLSDPVLVREDGTYLYTLPSVVDDAALGITHVIRGEDHIINTGVQIQLFEALGAAVPTFAHVNLLTTRDGEGLSKRSGALSLRSLRDEGVEPMAVASLAVLTGSSEEIHAYPDMTSLASHIDLARVSHASAKFDPADVMKLSQRLVHALGFAEVADRLDAAGVGGGEAFWLAVRGNLQRVEDAKLWWDIAVLQPIQPSPDLTGEDRAFLALAAARFPEGPVDPLTWKTWTDALKAETGRGGKNLFLPLRRALTGRDQGPELGNYLPFIGRERGLARLA